jgi:hypothetical protein
MMLALHAKMLAVFSRSRQAHTGEQRAAISEQARHPGLATGFPLRRSCATVAHKFPGNASLLGCTVLVPGAELGALPPPPLGVYG